MPQSLPAFGSAFMKPQLATWCHSALDTFWDTFGIHWPFGGYLRLYSIDKAEGVAAVWTGSKLRQRFVF